MAYYCTHIVALLKEWYYYFLNWMNWNHNSFLLFVAFFLHAPDNHQDQLNSPLSLQNDHHQSYNLENCFNNQNIFAYHFARYLHSQDHSWGCRCRHRWRIWNLTSFFSAISDTWSTPFRWVAIILRRRVGTSTLHNKLTRFYFAPDIKS